MILLGNLFIIYIKLCMGMTVIVLIHRDAFTKDFIAEAISKQKNTFSFSYKL